MFNSKLIYIYISLHINYLFIFFSYSRIDSSQLIFFLYLQHDVIYLRDTKFQKISSFWKASKYIVISKQ